MGFWIDGENDRDWNAPGPSPWAQKVVPCAHCRFPVQVSARGYSLFLGVLCSACQVRSLGDGLRGDGDKHGG